MDEGCSPQWRLGCAETEVQLQNLLSVLLKPPSSCSGAGSLTSVQLNGRHFQSWVTRSFIGPSALFHEGFWTGLGPEEFFNSLVIVIPGLTMSIMKWSRLPDNSSLKNRRHGSCRQNGSLGPDAQARVSLLRHPHDRPTASSIWLPSK